MARDQHNDQPKRITKTDVFKYAALPGFLPRIYALLTSGFSTLSYYIAIVYSMVNLLPPQHPYLNPANIGQYSIRNVITAAANNLVFKKQNIDQIIIFFTILGGLVLILIQIILLGVAIIASQQAFALDWFSVNELFVNPNATTGSAGPTQDLAFIILDQVFGLVGIFDSCVSVATPCENNAGIALTVNAATSYPYPFHDALHAMLQFYSLGIFIIACMVIIYFAITIVGETATTGTPFGQRFNRAWAPIRIVLFFAMITPISAGGQNSGLNGAQILTFHVAKYGSNFASNAWAFFNTSLTSGTYLGPNANIIGTPNAPEMGSLNQFMLVARTCAMAEGVAPYLNTVQPYLVRPEPSNFQASNPPLPGTIDPNAREFLSTSYSQALDFSSNGDIQIRFGTHGDFPARAGNIMPYCGDMNLITTDIFEPGSIYIAEEYYALIQNLWNDTLTEQVAECLVNTQINSPNVDPNCPNLPNNAYVSGLNTTYETYIDDAIANGVDQQRTNGDFLVPPELIEKGWAGAALWYNRVAAMNGAVIDAAANIPRHNNYPMIMEFIFKKRALEGKNVIGVNKYKGVYSDGQAIILPEGRQNIYPAIYEAYKFWVKNNASSSQTTQTGNPFIDTVNLLLGTDGLFNIRENADIHPLAQLTQVGKGMMNAVVRNAAIAGAGVVGEGLSDILDITISEELSKALGKYAFTVIGVSIGIAAILYYVLPFLPFIYFFFAISGWIKSIFEATVAMPLWALAHLRIDGEGIPGQDASNGYFLLLEIFLRPILILFGLIASISIFAALVIVLNSIFDLVIVNVGGADTTLETQISDGTFTLPSSIADVRGPIDEFFFTAMYTVICYIMGMSCFKLIDTIPDKILRWMGSNAKTFQESAGFDPGGKITQNVNKGATLLSGQVRGATQGDLAAITS